MKNIFSILLIMAMAMSFTACGGDDDPKPETREKWETWAGDWNDPDDDAYNAEYNGKYNPVRGAWQSESRPVNGYLFKEDVKLQLITVYDDKTYTIDDRSPLDYPINNKYIKIGTGSGHIPFYRYKVEGNILYLAEEDRGYVGEWRKMTKLTEQ